MDEIEILCEYLTEGHAFEDQHDEIEMPTGCDVMSVSVSPEGVTLHGHEKYGEGQTPYATTPDRHTEDLNHETQASAEGAVEYASPDGSETLRLPKVLYFEEQRDFPAVPTTPEELAASLETVLGFSPDITAIRARAIENGDLEV